MDIVDRIFELVSQEFKEQKDFAVALGLIPQRVSAWKRRTSASYTKYLPQIADALGTTTEYLLTGNGPKYRNQAGPLVDVSGSMAGGNDGQNYDFITTLDLGFGKTAIQQGKKEPAPISRDGLSPAKRQLLEAVDDLTDEQCEKLLGIVLEAKRLL